MDYIEGVIDWPLYFNRVTKIGYNECERL